MLTVAIHSPNNPSILMNIHDALVMMNERTGLYYAVWANDSLTAQNGLLQYVELDYEDCPRAFIAGSEKIAG